MNEHIVYILELLTVARDYVQRGWTQGATARDALGRECSANCTNVANVWSISGALYCAEVDVKKRHTANMTFGEYDCVESRIYPSVMIASNILADLAGRSSGRSFQYLETWNDAPERYKGEVLALFDKALMNVQHT